MEQLLSLARKSSKLLQEVDVGSRKGFVDRYELIVSVLRFGGIDEADARTQLQMLVSDMEGYVNIQKKG